MGQSPPPIPTVQEDTPILAVRWANILVQPDGRATFKSMTSWGGLFKADADADCARVEEARLRHELSLALSSGRTPELVGHRAPGWGCQCGFYAVPADKTRDWSHHYERGGAVRLLVELSGRVIEHDRGYRAEHQRVLEVAVPPCRWCQATSAVGLFTAGEGALHSWQCHDHTVAPAYVRLDLDLLTRRFGAKFTPDTGG